MPAMEPEVGVETPSMEETNAEVSDGLPPVGEGEDQTKQMKGWLCPQAVLYLQSESSLLRRLLAQRCIEN